MDKQYILCVFLLINVDIIRAAHVLGAPTVTTTHGTVQGATHQMVNVQVDVFKGIPYAKPPVGKLRFQKPEAPSPWAGVKVTTGDKTMCIQHPEPRGQESEDCLYLNIERPVGANTSLPVMFYIHGGGFTFGSKNFNGEVLASKGVVVVTINYRLGPLGFLSTEDARIPGNFGALDQLFALQWVQDNIAAFGGDPKSVTIFGESAGSACVSLLLLSPLSKGLFHRAIMMSGVASTSRDVPPPKTPFPSKLVSAHAGELVGCNHTASDFLTCLQSKDVHALYKACSDAVHQRGSVSTKWSPRVETVFGFMPDYPLRLIDRGEFMKVDTMRGFNAQEQGHLQDTANDGLTVAEFRKVAQNKLTDMPYIDPVVYMEKMVDTYLANATDQIETRSNAIELSSDFTFILPTILEARNAKLHNHGSKSFLYKFEYRSTQAKTPAWMGVLHASNMKFVSGNAHPNMNATDDQVAAMVGDMWTNFAKFSDPTPAGHTMAPLVHWRPLLYNHLNYMVISDHLEMEVYNTTQHEMRKLDLYSQTMQEYKAAIAPAALPVVG